VGRHRSAAPPAQVLPAPARLNPLGARGGRLPRGARARAARAAARRGGRGRAPAHPGGVSRRCVRALPAAVRLRLGALAVPIAAREAPNGPAAVGSHSRRGYSIHPLSHSPAGANGSTGGWQPCSRVKESYNSLRARCTPGHATRGPSRAMLRARTSHSDGVGDQRAACVARTSCGKGAGGDRALSVCDLASTCGGDG